MIKKYVLATRRSDRRATTMVEVVVAAMLLVTVMSFVTSLAYRIELVWRDTAQHRAAMNELSNQLGELTILPTDELDRAIGSLQASDVAARTLHQPKLSGEVIDDDFGTRLVLRLNWQRQHPGKPLELVAWLPTAESDDGQPTEAEE